MFLKWKHVSRLWYNAFGSWERSGTLVGWDKYVRSLECSDGSFEGFGCCLGDGQETHWCAVIPREALLFSWAHDWTCGENLFMPLGWVIDPWSETTDLQV
jgi:hypothetical protein